MRKLLRQYRLLCWISLILILGFVAVSATNFLVARDALQKNLADNSLTIASELVYSEIQKDLQKPALIATQMAHDSFLKDWVLHGEEDSAVVTNYLKTIKLHNNANASYFVSENTQTHYSANGKLAAPQITETKDQWYYRIKNSKAPFETIVELDIANRDNLNIVTNYKMLDDSGNFLGVVGIGISLDNIKLLMDSQQARFGRTIYLVDKKGNVLLSGGALKAQKANLENMAGLNQLSKQLLHSSKNVPQALEYVTQTGRVMVNARTIPELGWQLVIEQAVEGELRPLRSGLLINVVIGASTLLSVLILVLTSLRRYQRRIEKSAATDTLTKLLNRQAFDFVFRQALLDSERSRQPLCVVLLDIDHFKKINDKNGRLVGDHVLREIALLAKRSLRESDVICRWGGEEFLLLLKNCTLEKATSISENLRSTIAGNDFSRTTDLAKVRLSLSVSMGVAECKAEESEDSVFDRADVALRQAKESGRNSVYFSE